MFHSGYSISYMYGINNKQKEIGKDDKDDEGKPHVLIGGLKWKVLD